MRSPIIKRIGVLSITALLILLPGVPGIAAQGPDSETHLTLSLPTADLTLGDRIEALVQLTDGRSEPVAGAEINLTQSVEFMGGASDVNLGRIVTDEQGEGVAVLTLTSDGEMLVNADFAGDDMRSPSSATEMIEILPGPPLFHQTAGIRVPGINVYLLVAILGGVWTTYLAVMVILLIIARLGSLTPTAEMEATQ